MHKNKIRLFRDRDLPTLELYRGIDVTRYVARHVHWNYSLSVAETGVCINQTRYGQYYKTPGHLTVINAGESHSTSVPVGYSYSSRSLRIDPVLMSRIIEQVTGQQHDCIYLSQPVIFDMELSRQILDIHQSMEESSSRLEKECRLLAAFAKLLSRYSSARIKPDNMKNEHISVYRVCEFLHDCYNENVSLEKLAKIAGLSPFHLSRVFTKEKGVPPHVYQLNIRLKKATDLLALGRTIAETALDTGFYDQSHFQKAFKKKFGVTPRQYGC